jgi:hypothetical protein
MAQYNITATSAKKNLTKTNTDKKRYPSPAEFATAELAQANADKYAKGLNQEDAEETWDWVGHATAV